MASVSSLGVGSGLDLQGLLDKLMAVEQLPITALQKQADSYQTKISALGTLSSKLSALQTAAKNLTPATLQTATQKFATYTGAFADADFGKVTVGDGAVTGSYALEVTQLAKQQKIRSGSLTNANVKTAADAGTKITISAGTLAAGSFTADSERSTTIDLSSLSTLEEVRNAVNAQAKNTGVTASIVNDGTGKRLIFSSDKEGSDQAFQIASDSGSGPSIDSGFLAYNPVTGTPGFSTTQKAIDAKFTLDGIAITSKSNKVTNVLDGVTLDLAKEDKTTLTVATESSSKLKDSLQKFVEAYNSAAQTINSLGSYDTETKVAGTLNGNRILRETQQELRNLVFNTSFGETGEKLLSDVGISFGGTDNTLKLDADKLAAAVAKDPETVANLAAKVGKEFNDKINEIVGTGGSIQISTDGMKTTIRDLESRQEKLTLSLEKMQERYRKQFSALDSLLSSMNSTSSYLAQQLTSIASISSSSRTS
ncbi:MAG: flagellar filament capping protein FliD [Zoogloeaceae bacterium]|jgi:flagellar hook-associated protein 2|nr:flagellar filament capping protein FliD [Zoogloeaceae bacterium]